MWIKEHSKVYKNVDAGKIWQLWTDVDNWHTWHGDLDYCKLEGDFKVGNHFMLKPKGIRPFKIMLTDIKPGKEFTDCTKFFGAKMFDTHSMEETPEGLRLSNKLVVTGFLKFIWIKLVAQNVADTVPDEMDALVGQASNV